MNLEAECIRSKAESTGGCVKLKTVTDVTLYGSLQPPANRNIVQNEMMLSLCVCRECHNTICGEPWQCHQALS